MTGKGSRNRTKDHKAYREHFDNIFRRNAKTKNQKGKDNERTNHHQD